MRRVVLVTGASSGIGAATAHELAARGWEVFGASRRPPSHPEGAALRWLAMDVRDEASVRAGVETLLAQAGRLDALVCNAGIGIFGSVEEVPLEKARAQLDTNFFGTLAPLRAALPRLRAQGAGRVAIVGSLAGRAPIPFQAHYSASKAALDALALALRVELAPFGVAVSLIEPGDFKTDFNERTDWGEIEASAYGVRLRRCAGVIRETLRSAPGPEAVARAVARALESRRPRVRYAVGPSSRLVPLARRLLPDALALKLISGHFRV